MSRNSFMILHELPAEAPLDAQVSLRHRVVDRRTDFHNLAILCVYRHSATHPAIRTNGFRARLARFVPRSRGTHLVFDLDRKSTRLNSSHGYISYAVFCLKKKIT